MKTCADCGTSIGDGAIQCYNCKSKNFNLSTKRICPICKSIYAGKERCPDCGAATALYSAPSSSLSTYNRSGSYGWAFVLAFFIPLIGIIMGAAMAASGDDSRIETGKHLLIFSVVITIVVGIILVSII